MRRGSCRRGRAVNSVRRLRLERSRDRSHEDPLAELVQVSFRDCPNPRESQLVTPRDFEREAEFKRGARDLTMSAHRVGDGACAIDDLEGDGSPNFEAAPVDREVCRAGHAEYADALEDLDLLDGRVRRRGWRDDGEAVGCAVSAAKGDRDGLALDDVGAAVPVAPGRADVRRR